MRDYHVTGTWGTPRERETPHTAREYSITVAGRETNARWNNETNAYHAGERAARDHGCLEFTMNEYEVNAQSPTHTIRWWVGPQSQNQD